MIVRIATAVVTEKTSPTFLRAWHDECLPKYRSSAGLLSVSLLVRQFVSYYEVLVISSWRSKPDSDQFVRGGLETWPKLAGVIVVPVEGREYGVVASFPDPDGGGREEET